MLSIPDFAKHYLSKVLHGQTETNRLDKRTTRWAENCLTCQVQRIVVSDKTSTWRFLCSDVPQGLMLGPILFNSIIDYLNNWTEGSVGRFEDYMKLWHGDWCTTQLYCHSEVHWQSAETGWEKPHEGMALCNSTGLTE